MPLPLPHFRRRCLCRDSLLFSPLFFAIYRSLFRFRSLFLFLFLFFNFAAVFEKLNK